MLLLWSLLVEQEKQIQLQNPLLLTLVVEAVSWSNYSCWCRWSRWWGAGGATCTVGTAGTVNLGGGGGGGGGNWPSGTSCGAGGQGGSGSVYLRFPSAESVVVSPGTNTVTTCVGPANDTVAKFTVTGTLTL